MIKVVAGILILAASCGSTAPRPIRLDWAEFLVQEGRHSEAGAVFEETLTSLEKREPDYEIHIARVRIHQRLFQERLSFERLPPEKRGAFRSAAVHLTLVARSAVEILAGLAPPEMRTEAARAAAMAFTMKGSKLFFRMDDRDNELTTFLLRRISECFACHCEGLTLEQTAREISAQLAEASERNEDFRSIWRRLSTTPDNRPSDRAFAVLPLGRHIQEGTHAQDLGTRERTARGDRKQVFLHYIEALFHLTLVRECTVEPTVGEENALGAIDLLHSSIERLAAVR